MQPSRLAVLSFAFLLFVSFSFADTLEVGPGKPFSRIEDANRRARAGDVVLVHPLSNGKPYDKVAVYVTQPGIAFRAVPDKPGERVVLSGKDFDYSGVGSIPRAIFQFNRGADNCLLEGFELTAAHNDSHNGAGVRINQANNVTVRSCLIHHNDMGIMSNGDGTINSAVNQLIESCIIRENGDPEEPGYNHNLYLGGASVTLRACEVAYSLTGHNVKSRAHLTRVMFCYVHHSANREFDLVDAPETALPDSHALLVGNLIIKDPDCKGNRAVIHFGQDGGKEHDGTVYLVNNTVVTPFISPVVELSSAKAHAYLANNIIYNGFAQANQVLVAVRAGADLSNASGSHNLLSGGWSSLPPGFPPAENFIQHRSLPFVDPARQDYHLARFDEFIVNAGLPWADLPEPLRTWLRMEVRMKDAHYTVYQLDRQYKPPASIEPRIDAGAPDLGAYSYRPKP